MNRLEYFEARCEATLSPMEYAAASDRDPDAFFLVDVRNAPAEKMRVKAAGAHLIPLNTLTERLSEVPKDRTIVLCCWNVWCNMASRAAVILLRNGYDAKELIGGIAAWEGLGLPVESLV